MRSAPTAHSGRRLLALVLGALLLGAASVGFDAATAHAASIGPQQVLRPPRAFPVEFVGRQYTMGEPIPRGHVVLRRRVVLRVDERHAVHFSCPRGTVAISPAAAEGTSLGFQVRDRSQYRHPRRRFVLVAEAYPNAPDGLARGRLYLLCGPRGRA